MRTINTKAYAALVDFDMVKMERYSLLCRHTMDMASSDYLKRCLDTGL